MALGLWSPGHLRVAGRERVVMACAMFLTAPAVMAGWLGLVGLLAGLMVAGVLAGPIDVGVLTLRQRRTATRRSWDGCCPFP